MSYAWGTSGSDHRPSWRDRSDTVMVLRWWRARITGYLHLHGLGRSRDRVDGARARPHMHGTLHAKGKGKIMPTVFPQSDQFPLGCPYGLVPGEPEPASAARPFGLAVTARPVRPGSVASLDPDRLAYDHDAQIGLIRDGDEMVPLARHTDGQTNTTTNADGHRGNDSDTDHRED